MKPLGLLGGMSWESTAVYYRLLNEGARARLGGLHSAPLLLHSFDFAAIARLQAAGATVELAELMTAAARGLERAGAAGVMICANTMHSLAPQIEAAIGIPLIHVVDVTARAIEAAGCRRPALLATRYTMEQGFYRQRLAQGGLLSPAIPDARGRLAISDIIFEELCRGIIRPQSRATCLHEVERMRPQAIDSVILGCTELTLLLSQGDFALPVFDTTQLHVAAGLDFAFSG
ncbi:MAG: aspartate/glutamate racemase [Methylobacterium sp. SCN 67-24]|nr:MAG: aspartate/glutamate racemase [Methylobacterium sp. SCN 67-24]